MSHDFISRNEVMKLIESKFVNGALMEGDKTMIDGYSLLDEVSDMPTVEGQVGKGDMLEKLLEEMYAECWCEEDLEEQYNELRSLSAVCLERRAEKIGLDPDTVGY